MSQEQTEADAFYNEEPVLEETTEQVEEVAPAQPEPVAPANQALIAELQQTRQTARQAQEELHALRVATLHQSAAQPTVDPIEVAMAKIEKTMDPDAYKFVAPGLRLMVTENYAMRQREEALSNENSQLRQTVNEIASEARSRKVYGQLAAAIPDLDAIGPQLTALLGKYPANVQQMYIDNPQLLVPLADGIRTSNGSKPGKNVQAERNKLNLDLGGTGERAAQLTASEISSMRPGSKEFESQRKSFWGETE